MAGFPYRLVTVDIDGTLTTVHGWGYLAERLGRTREFERTQAEFTAGTSDEDRHLRHLLEIAEGVPRREIARILADTPRVAGIREGVERLHHRGARVALLTHNPTYVCDWYRAEFGMDAAEGMIDSPKFRGGRVGPTGEVRADKVGGLRRLVERFGIGVRDVAHVGDGRADAAVFPLVGLGVAFGTRIPEVREAADVTVEGRDFQRVVDLLERRAPARS